MSRIRVVSVLGGRGKMGNLFVERSRAAGLKAHALDKPLDRSEVQAAFRESDLVVYAGPIDVFDDVLAQTADFLAPPCILTDICSVKVEPLRSMRSSYDGPVVGTHPLFGPEPTQDAKVAVTPTGANGEEKSDGRSDPKDETAAVFDWLLALGFQPFYADAHEHDKAMAVIQGLNFATTVSYMAAVGMHPNLREFATPSFERRLVSAKKMVTEDAALFTCLFDSNPYSQEAVRVFRSMLNIAAGGDIELLAEQASGWWKNEPDADDDSA